METKYCSKCCRTLDVMLFAQKVTGRSHQCKECHRAYSKSHYQANKAAHRVKIDRYKQRVQQFIREYKEANPCVDCGRLYHFAAMDFDHLDGSIKSFSLGDRAHHTFPQVREEMKKCELVCSNCHRVRTWQRNQSPQ